MKDQRTGGTHRWLRRPAAEDVYSIQRSEEKEIRKAKGVKKCIVKKHHRHEQYNKEALFEKKTHREGMDMRRSECYQIYGLRVNKVYLLPLNSKRWIAKERRDTLSLAYGHKDCNAWASHQLAAQSPERREAALPAWIHVWARLAVNTAQAHRVLLQRYQAYALQGTTQGQLLAAAHHPAHQADKGTSRPRLRGASAPSTQLGDQQTGRDPMPPSLTLMAIGGFFPVNLVTSSVRAFITAGSRVTRLVNLCPSDSFISRAYW